MSSEKYAKATTPPRIGLGTAPIRILPGTLPTDNGLIGLYKSSKGGMELHLFGTSPHVTYWVDPSSKTMEILRGMSKDQLSKKAYEAIHNFYKVNEPSTTIEPYAF